MRTRVPLSVLPNALLPAVADGPALPIGTLLDLEVGAPAAGGACVARMDGRADGRVVFVRHALPGETVRARVTEDRGGAYCRADAVEILTPASDRVRPPCPHAGPGRCGGCDFQHVAPAAQRELKASVIRDQFARVGRLPDLPADVFAGVEELPGGCLGWRTRITYAVDRDGRPGLHRHGSHEIERIERCVLGTHRVGDAAVLQQHWPGLTGVEVVQAGSTDPDTTDPDTTDPDTTVLAHRPGPGRQARGRRPPDRVEVIEGAATVRRHVGGRAFTLAAAGFWQVHPAAAATFAVAAVAALGPRPGERVLDLFAGAGALTAAFATAVGPTGTVLGIESDAAAVADAQANLLDLPWAQVRRGRVGRDPFAQLSGELGADVDLVVLDPPRSGAGAEAMTAILDLRPRAVAYLSCDPATLARDVATAVRGGWRLAALRAFDAFPMTHHVECLATLLPA